MVTPAQLGPRDLMDSDSNRFALSNPDLIAIQAYANDGQQLASDEPSMRAVLHMDPSDSFDDFKRLVECYATIKSHCSDWTNTYFPGLVQCADDVVHYAQKATVYFQPLRDLLPKLSVPNPDPKDVAAFTAILKVLADAATAHSTAATLVYSNVTAFASACATDHNALSGQGGVAEYYNNLYGTGSQAVTDLQDDLAAAQQALAGDQAEYRHDVIVASTSPSYVWVWPLGTIAAAIVAGVYGHLAVEAMHRVEADQQEIDTDNAQLARDARLVSDIQGAQASITDINNKLTAVLPVIQRLQSSWQDLSSDLANIIDTVNTDIGTLPAVLKDVAIQEAIDEWTACGKAADAYRSVAFITFPTSLRMAA